MGPPPPPLLLQLPNCSQPSREALLSSAAAPGGRPPPHPPERRSLEESVGHTLLLSALSQSLRKNPPKPRNTLEGNQHGPHLSHHILLKTLISTRSLAAGEASASASAFSPKQLPPSLSSCRWCFHCPRSVIFFYIFLYYSFFLLLSSTAHLSHHVLLRGEHAAHPAAVLAHGGLLGGQGAPHCLQLRGRWCVGCVCVYVSVCVLYALPSCVCCVCVC